MKLKHMICLLLVCVILTGCGVNIGGKDGDMEAAVSALKWQDYQTAYDEATAFLKRVPHSANAKVVQETAAWSLLYLDKDQLDGYALTNGEVSVHSYGFSVSDMVENAIGGEFYIKGYEVGISYDSDYFQQDFRFPALKLDYVRIMWGYKNSYKTFYFKVDDPENIYRSNLTYSMDNCYITGDQLADETKEALVQYFVTAWLPSMDEVFGIIQENYKIAPEHLGFENWNQTVSDLG